MRRGIALLLLVLVVAACGRVPITGRRQFNLLPEGDMVAMSLTAYQEFLQENRPLPPTDRRVQQVRRIGSELAAAATAYLNDHGAGYRVQGFAWEFNVVDDATVNAWCMPGGKVVVYTGILPITATEEGLALVMGHEIAHAIARHGNERMSQAIAAQGVGMTLETMTGTNPGLTRDILLRSFGIGSQLGMLAFSRKHETEADKMGLVFMAMAGYDPRVAPDFWKRMAAQGNGGQPEFLSTHPSDARRVADLEAYMPHALKYYKPR